MDVLVKWEDGSTNVVSANEIETVESGILTEGVKIKMYWLTDRKHYYGTVVSMESAIENLESEDSMDIPLSMVKTAAPTYIHDKDKDKSVEVTVVKEATDDQRELLEARGEYLDSDSYDSDCDPPYKQECEYVKCKAETSNFCPRCKCLLCPKHFGNNDNCEKHRSSQSSEDESYDKYSPRKRRPQGATQNQAMPSTSIAQPLTTRFAVDGERREVPIEKKKRESKRRMAHQLRTEGKAYISPSTRKSVSARSLKPRCSGISCENCTLITEDERQKIFTSFFEIQSLHLQREFILRHVKVGSVKRSRSDTGVSRRSSTHTYNLPYNNDMVQVCKSMFLNTLSISEKTMRTALTKKSPQGVLAPEKRGGRYKHLRLKDKQLRDSAAAHINRFPRMESHYCRKSSSREYLHSDLSKAKMYDLYTNETDSQLKASYTTYCRVFRSMNLSFHHPKKDQCSLCFTYREADEAKKMELHDVYNRHEGEKIAVREKKDRAKTLAKDHPKRVATAVFDLQQVIQLPISNESAVFYRRRLSTYNFTVYNIGNKDCHCFMWHEAISKRGSCEIATCVGMYLQQLDAKGIEEVKLFSDGCSGQNKNTIVVAMLLYTLTNSTHLKTISLCFFEPNHGQSEGDSAHSSISTALSRAGDVLIPCQLPPILRLARRSTPYQVHTMEVEDFYNYKSVSEDIRIRSIRKFDSGKKVDWTVVCEIMVTKEDLTCIYIKNSHLDQHYEKLYLKRNTLDVLQKPVPSLNDSAPKISTEKYQDLQALCSGQTPVIRDKTSQKFYQELPHL